MLLYLLYMTIKKGKKIQPSIKFPVILLSIFVLGFVAGQYVDLVNIFSKTSKQKTETRQYIGEEITLPAPNLFGSMSVEEAMQNRRSRRAYVENEALTVEQVSQILWSLQGQTADWGGHTVPSAKNAYPLNITLVAKNVTDLAPGVYHYIPENNSLKKVVEDVPANFDEAAVQAQNKSAPVSFIISGDYSLMANVFDGEPRDENVVLEAGHAGQNAYLQAESLGLGTVVSGGLNQDLMKEILKIPAQEDLFYMIPVGVPAAEIETSH